MQLPAIKSILKAIPGGRKLYLALLALRHSQNPFLKFAPPGHFYSPLPDLDYVEQHRDQLFDRDKDSCPGIALNVDRQLSLIKEAAAFYNELPFPEQQQGDCRYYYNNTYFGPGSAVMLYSMMRYFRPRRIIEVGSGFSSAAMLDINDRFFAGGTHFTFIEPYPDRLFSLLSQNDREKHDVVIDIVQNVPRSVFSDLGENDVLFIDSSHVAKAGSDVVLLLTEIMPRLQPGVIIHIHDIYWPFEYPEKWIAKGKAWNEAYLVKAFLQFNQAFEILAFNSYLGMHQREAMQQYLPRFVSDAGSGLWIRKTD